MPENMPSKPTAVELDFLGLHRDTTTITSPSSSTSSKSQLRRLYDRRHSFREVQNAITKINPELLRAGLCTQDSGAGKSNGAAKSISVPNPGQVRDRAAPAAAPLTIFYNGTVSVFDLPQDKAETILKFVEEGWFNKPLAEDQKSDWMAHTTQTRMLHRNVSLQRFLEKRKERLTAMPTHNGDGNQKKMDNNIIN